MLVHKFARHMFNLEWQHSSWTVMLEVNGLRPLIPKPAPKRKADKADVKKEGTEAPQKKPRA
jgi:hypothetical protein